MADYVSASGASPAGQHVEYRQYPGGGDSLAESRAAVVVSGRTVASGWSSDGVTYGVYTRWLRGEPTAEDGACMFHGRPYPGHDFYYGPECRRCGKEQYVCADCGKPIHYPARTMQAPQVWEHVGHSGHPARKGA